jgi:putative transposase
MPRANRYIVSGQIYHITHRCHNRTFLFKFAKDRDGCRSLLRDRLGRFPVSCLGYCITSNHTHLLLKVEGIAEQVLGRFMQTLEGGVPSTTIFARDARGRSGVTVIMR